MAPMSGNSKRNIVFFGETGMGKSSAINLLLENGPFANVSNDARPCTQTSTSYETTLYGTTYNLWDTRGLSEARGFQVLQAIFGLGLGPEKELKKFLKERHQRHEIDLLVYCVRGSRATKASVQYYNKFCTITRRLAAPVVIVITQLERENDMGDWWNTNSFYFKELKMEFDGYACITTLAKHPLLRAESKKKLIELITRDHCWEVKDSGSYFGSPVRRPTAPTTVPVPPPSGVSSFFKRNGKGNAATGGLDHYVHNYPRPSGTPPSLRNSGYYTTRESVPPSAVVELPTPRDATTSANVPRIDPDHLRVRNPSHSASEGTSSAPSSSPPVTNISSQSSYILYSDVHLQSCTEENEAAIVRRRRGYAAQCGAFGDVWECDLILGESSRLVAVKAVKTGTNDHKDPRSNEKTLRRELKVWGRLRHKNIVPLLGVVSGFGPLPSMMPHLSKKHQLLKDIAAGLCYLHSQDVIHGDLHSDNVLIDENGTACLTDFGLSLIKDFIGTSYLRSSICGAVQFADPALVKRVYDSQDNVFYPTKPCDVYSFGGLMLHVLSGKKPYWNSTQFFRTVLNGERSQIPTHKDITPQHESEIKRCWDPEEVKRPLAGDLPGVFEPNFASEST